MSDLKPRIAHNYDEILRDDGTVEMSYNYLDYFLAPEEDFNFDGEMFYARHYLDEPGDVIIMAGDPGAEMLAWLQQRYDRIRRFSDQTGCYEAIWQRPRA